MTRCDGGARGEGEDPGGKVGHSAYLRVAQLGAVKGEEERMKGREGEE